MPDLAIETINLHKHYGKLQAVRGLNLQVPVGRIYGFLGPNGAGKSTTIRMLLGLIKPTGGEVRLFGHAVGINGPPQSARVGALVEGPAFVDYLSARRNLQMLADLSGGAEPGRVERVLELVGLAARQNSKVKTYSQGMRQRLGIAQALLPHPRLVILDEPALGLDPQGLVEIRDLLLRLRDEEQMTIFLSSHLLHEVQLTCDDVCVVMRGELVASGSVDELLRVKAGQIVAKVDDPERAAQVAAALPYVGAASVREGLLQALVEPERVAELNTALVQAGLRVSSLTDDQPDLERVYLELMARDEAAH
ncbi:MAG: ABC transporter ATP-binding protein [Armatimonadota bacterium]